MASLHTLAFEIGTEEIPAFDLHKATGQLEKLVPEALDAVRIPHGTVSVHTTPRRLIVLAEDVADETEALQEVFRGPSAKIAFDAEGNPTKAAIGFARGKGLDVEALERREENGAEYVFAERSVPARDVAELLPGVLEGVITGISWPKSCRWGTRSEFFSRPVRWLVALLDERVVPVEFAGLTAGRLTRGHRFLAPGPHEVAAAADLLPVVEGAFVVTSEQAREQRIRAGVAEAEAQTGYHAELPEKTLLEVVNLSEYPTVLVGTFDEEFLRVPEEIIVDAMLMHQRYFPLYDGEGRLTNKFIVVTNGDPAHAATIIDGNERVVRARLSDAKFFYEEDLKHPLETYVDRLDEVVFQEVLGTMKDKTDRIAALARHLAADAQLGAADAADAERAAYLAKADLVTNAVVEFTSVQGVMGSYYAEASGENEQVARAIADHYRPRFSGDEPPASDVGRVVAMADKLDTICGLFAVGQGAPRARPTRSRCAAAPSASWPCLRPACPCRSWGPWTPRSPRTRMPASASTATTCVPRWPTSSSRARRSCCATPARPPTPSTPCWRQAWRSRPRSSPACAPSRPPAPASARRSTIWPRPTRAPTTCATRAGRGGGRGPDGRRRARPRVRRARRESQVAAALAADDYAGALAALADLRAPIDAFFADVLVMDEDEAVRVNRLRLLNRFVGVFTDVADFGKMAKGGK